MPVLIIDAAVSTALPLEPSDGARAFSASSLAHGDGPWPVLYTAVTEVFVKVSSLYMKIRFSVFLFTIFYYPVNVKWSM